MQPGSCLVDPPLPIWSRDLGKWRAGWLTQLLHLLLSTRFPSPVWERGFCLRGSLPIKMAYLEATGHEELAGRP